MLAEQFQTELFTTSFRVVKVIGVNVHAPPRIIVIILSKESLCRLIIHSEPPSPPAYLKAVRLGAAEQGSPAPL